MYGPRRSVTVMLVIVMFVVVAHGEVLNTRDLVEVYDDGIAARARSGLFMKVDEPPTRTMICAEAINRVCDGRSAYRCGDSEPLSKSCG